MNIDYTVHLEQMVVLVEQYILMNTGQRIKIVLRTFSTPEGVEYYDKDLQLLGRAFDIATGKVFTKLN